MNISFKTFTQANFSTTEQAEELFVLEKLAHKIWNDWYISIISKEQIDYMLAKGYSPESLLYQIMEQNHEFTLVYSDNVLVGYMSVSLLEEEKSYFLHKFYLDVSLHQKGIGKQMFQHLEEKYTPKKLRLRVNRCNFKAINFYFRSGFFIEKVDTLEIDKGYKMEDFVMVKKNYELRIGN